MKSNRLLILLLLSLFIIGAVIIINLLAFANVEKAVVNQIKQNQKIETEHTVSQIEAHVNQVKDELITLSKFPVIENLDLNKCNGDMSVVHEKIKGKIESLLRVDKEGNIIECSSPKSYCYFLCFCV